jgi:ATP diphosphatase
MNKRTYNLDDLKQLLSRLRNLDNGCPWDIEQNFKTIKPHTIEEAYEVADAIERDDMNDLKDELGDLLFQVIFHAQMASEQSLFNMDDVINHVTKKMIFRHPHVFGDETADDANEVKNRVWEAQKAKEQANKNDTPDKHYLDSVTTALPSLLLANKIQSRVHKVGFEFPSINHVYDKLSEEIAELKEACAEQNNDAIEEELGDVLFCSALVGQTLNINCEEALRKSNLKFIKRFNGVEDILKRDGLSLDAVSLEKMMDAWSTVKTNTQKL